MFKSLSLVFTSLALVLAFGSSSAMSSTPAQKDWTLLVYLNGNNNLDSYGAFNIKQMEKVGSTSKINIVVQWASLENGKTQRLLVTKSTDPTKVTSPIVQDLGAVDMGDYRSLTEFITWGAANYPAKHYFVDVWDHGSGWHAIKANGGVRSGMHISDISWDDNTGHSMTTVQLGTAIKDAAKAINHKIDIYGSDACLMAMAEVAGEMKDVVDVYAGSQELEPGAGWPYDALLQKWDALPSASAADVGKILTTEYVKSYQGGSNGSQEVTFSAYDLTKMDHFYAELTNLGAKLAKLDKPSRAKVVGAFTTAQTFYYSDYRDMGDFLDVLEKAKVPALGSSALAGMHTAMGEFVIANADTSTYAKAHGVSVWMPGTTSTLNTYSNLYKGLAFQNATGWEATLRYVLQDTKTP